MTTVEPSVSRRAANVAPFFVMALLRRARALEASGLDVIHMEIGEPDFPTPEGICAAGQRAIAQQQTHYTQAAGLPALRASIASHYQIRFGVTVEPERIFITPGASGALLLALLLTTDPGDAVVLPDPGYPCNRHFLTSLGVQTIALPVDARTAFQPDPVTVAALSAPWRALLLASPANPTGCSIAPARLGQLADACDRAGAHLIVDEIYHELVYERNPETALSMNPNTLIINSFSKYYGMTGWRLGWLVVPDALIDAAERLCQNLFIAAPTLAQHAALAAFDEECRSELERRREAFGRRRDRLLHGLAPLGFDIPVRPDGAFYLYADVSGLTDDSFAFCERMLEETGVAITPGRDFGQHWPERYVRFAYTTTEARIDEALGRIAHWLRRQ